MNDALVTTLFLAAGTFAARYAGVVAGQHLPRTGPWIRALNALPGCLIVSLVAVLLASGGPREWAAGAAALAAAMATRNLPAAMAAAIATLWVLRQLT